MPININPIFAVTPNVKSVRIPTANAQVKSDGTSAGSGGSDTNRAGGGIAATGPILAIPGGVVAGGNGNPGIWQWANQAFVGVNGGGGVAGGGGCWGTGGTGGGGGEGPTAGAGGEGGDGIVIITVW